MALAYSDEPSRLTSSTVGWACNQAATVLVERSGRTSIGTERTRLTDERPRAQSAFPRPVIQANYARRWSVGQRMMADETQNGIATATDTQLAPQPRSCLASHQEAKLTEHLLQSERTLSMWVAQLWQTFSENLLGTGALHAEKATHRQDQMDRTSTGGQIMQFADVATLYPRRVGSTRRT